MEEALYGERGYYRQERFPAGQGEESGDYLTGSALSPLFARATARLLRRLDAALGRPADYLEAGFGGAVHLGYLAAALAPGSAPGRRLLAYDRVPRPVPPGVERIEGFAAIAERSLDGLIFSYELFDALPVHRLIGRADGSLGELWVEQDEAGAYSWRERELSDPRLADLLRNPDVNLDPGQVADVAPGWRPLYADLARRLGRGLLITCDYGFERAQLFDPRIRRNGTLAAYSRQRVHRNPFVLVGEQDLTAHVDFTTLLQAGEAEGLKTFALTRQSLWLTACGLFEELEGADRATRLEAMALLDGEGMGEEIRVLVQGRGVEVAGLFDPPL
jgi:SAM-dependent MidA family methyltransferase